MSGDCLSAAAERCRIDDVLDFIDRGLKSMPYYGVTSRATPALWKTQSSGGACSLPFAQGIRHLNEQRLQLPEPPGAHSRGRRTRASLSTTSFSGCGRRAASTRRRRSSTSPRCGQILAKCENRAQELAVKILVGSGVPRDPPRRLRVDPCDVHHPNVHARRRGRRHGQQAQRRDQVLAHRDCEEEGGGIHTSDVVRVA